LSRKSAILSLLLVVSCSGGLDVGHGLRYADRLGLVPLLIVLSSEIVTEDVNAYVLLIILGVVRVEDELEEARATKGTGDPGLVEELVDVAASRRA